MPITVTLAPYKIRQGTAVVLAVLLLAQGLMAAASPCPGVMDSGMAMSEMDHSMHDMAAMSDAAAPSQPCCDGDGLCSMPGCLATVALPGLQMLNLPPAAIALSNSHPLRTPERTLDTHFRPPISP